MGFLTPAEPGFDVDEWSKLDYQQRLRVSCQEWAMRGFGAPGVAYTFYVFKLALYLGGFVLFALTTQGVDSLGEIASWWSLPAVFEKAVLWTMLYEMLGFGCGSGPLTGHFMPPVTAFLSFLRPGTLRLAPFGWMPGTSGDRRTFVDVALYVGSLSAILVALCSSEIRTANVLTIVGVMLLLGLRDKTAFLAARPEHYLLTTLVFAFPADVIPGAKAIQVALWLGAASSKLTHHFPSVFAVMTSNNPFNRIPAIRRLLYRDFPNDLRSSQVAFALAHAATVIEFDLPLLLVVTTSGPLHTFALVGIVTFHLLILTSFPMGVPLEWNAFFIYSAVTLFGEHASVRIWDLHSPVLATILFLSAVVVPIIGNLRPDKVSFLPSMRYYAGNWAFGTWVMRPGVAEEIDDALPTSSTTMKRQIDKLQGPGHDKLAVGRGQAFRARHLHGRMLTNLIELAIADLTDPAGGPRAIDDFDIYDGETIAGFVLGWNFGDGHLHDERMIRAVQTACQFKPGDLRCILVESQAVGDPFLRWRIFDACTGSIAHGATRVSTLLDHQPWSNTVDIGTMTGVST